MLISEAVELYLARPSLSEGTRISYRHQMMHMIRFVGDKPISDITHAELLRYIAWRQGQGKSNRSLNLMTMIFKAIFGWLVENEYCLINPAQKLDRLYESPIPEDVRAVSLKEWERMMTFAKRKSPRDYALLAFLMDSACRVSAGVSLRLEKLDLAGFSAVVYEKKIQRWVDVAFSPATAKALEIWLQNRPDVNHSFVFTSSERPYEPMQTEGVRYIMKRISKILGMRVISPHMLRHAALQHLAKQPDVTLLDVQTKANHLSARTTLENYFPQKSERVFELSQKYSLVEQEAPAPVPLLRVLPKPG